MYELMEGRCGSGDAKNLIHFGFTDFVFTLFSITVAFFSYPVHSEASTLLDSPAPLR